MSLVGEKVRSVEVLTKGIRNDLAAIRAKASEGAVQVYVNVYDARVVLWSSLKLNACEKRSSLFVFVSLFLAAWVDLVAQVARGIRRRIFA